MKNKLTVIRNIRLHWTHIVLLLLSIIFLGALFMGVLVQNSSVINSIDSFFYTLIANMPRNPLIDILIWPVSHNFISIISPYPSYFIVLNAILIIFMALFKRNQLLWCLIILLIASLLASLSLYINSELIFRERPFVHLPSQLSEATKNGLLSWTSFPSGHTRDTAVYATIFAHFIPRLRLLMIALALFVAFSRVYLGVHYPIDVIAGLIFGFLVAKVTIILVKEIEIILTEKLRKRKKAETLKK